MTSHGAFSIVLNIRSGQKQALADYLETIVKNDVETNTIIPFAKLSSIHFARLLILDASIDSRGKSLPDRLAFTTNYDLPLDNHINELLTHAGNGLWKIFSMCESGPAGNYNADALRGFLMKQNFASNTFYKGIGYRSVQQVRQEEMLRKSIEQFLNGNKAVLKNDDAGIIRSKIIEFVNAQPQFDWAKAPEPGQGSAWKMAFYSKAVLAALIVLMLLPVIIPFVIVWMLIILSVELREKFIPNNLTKAHMRELVSHETQIVQAQFSALGNIKPGWFRKRTMLFLLRSTDFLAPYLFSQGKLSGIPTVHFARWLIINDDRQMLFLSNYDGNSENYLRDFINIAAKQLTLMFCHTEGYPKTRFMVFGGAKDARGFMEWARSKQIVTNVWYSANKGVTVKNIFNNGKIREGLYGTMTEDEAVKWLSRL